MLCRATRDALACTLCGGTQVGLVTTVGVQAKGKPHRIPALAPVASPYFDQTEQYGPEVGIPVDFGSVAGGAGLTLPAVKLFGQVSGVCQFELRKVGSMRR